MERRQFVSQMGILAAGLAATTVKSARAQAPTVKSAAPSPLLLKSSTVIKMLPAFAEVASTCTLKGDLCIQMCEEQLTEGNAEFANCLVSASQMVVICGAVTKLATLKSVRLNETLEACLAACKSCKEACEEHKAHWKHGMHLECKACAESCDKMITAVNKLKAALAGTAS
jgi:Cys-rich four helix bundle protein (predicted Tat secretion target)